MSARENRDNVKIKCIGSITSKTYLVDKMMGVYSTGSDTVVFSLNQPVWCLLCTKYHVVVFAASEASALTRCSRKGIQYPLYLRSTAESLVTSQCMLHICFVVHMRGAPTEEGNVRRDGRGEGLHLCTEERLDGAPRGRPEGVRHQVRRVARYITEGRQVVSIGSRTGRRHTCGKGKTRGRTLR